MGTVQWIDWAMHACTRRCTRRCTRSMHGRCVCYTSVAASGAAKVHASWLMHLQRLHARLHAAL